VPGIVSAALLVLLFGLCVLTLPWTLGSVPDRGVSVPRYNAGSITDARTPPWWWGGSKDDSRGKPAPLAPERSKNSAQSVTTPGFLLGSDALGRSLLVRVLAGGGVSLTIGIAAALLSVVIGTLYGAISGYAGGRTDALLMRIVDVLYGLPYILLVVLLAVASDALLREYVSREAARDAWVREAAGRILETRHQSGSAAAVARLLAEDEALAAQLKTSALAAVPPREISQAERTALDLAVLLVAIGGVSWLTMARVIRGQVLSLKHQPFIEAARAIGASRSRIFVVHLLPNLAGPIIVYATLTVPQAILQESFLSFLGIGVKPPLPSWGNLASEGLGELNPYESNWWLLFFPCLLLALTLLSLNFVGEGLREALDPKREQA
jgi:oligopeptide transport system permease protein